MSRLVDRDNPVSPVELLPQVFPRIRGAGKAVQHDDWRPIATCHDVQRETVCSSNFPVWAAFALDDLLQSLLRSWATASHTSRCISTLRARLLSISMMCSPFPAMPVAIAWRNDAEFFARLYAAP